MAGIVARDRRERGLKLNHPEMVALLSTWVIERAREGAYAVMDVGRIVAGGDIATFEHGRVQELMAV